jgi:hypothetical protein
MILDGKVTGLPLVTYTGTKTTIQAITSGSMGMLAYATDTHETGAYSGSAWKWSAVMDSANVGMVRQSDTWHAYGGFQLSTTTIACTLNTWAWITNAGHNLWVAVESSGVTLSGDVFTAVHTGDYVGQVTLSISSLNGRDFFIRVFNITTNAQMGYIIGATTTGTPNYMPITLPLYMELTAGDTFRFEVENITDNSDPDVRSAVYNIVYVHD